MCYVQCEGVNAYGSAAEIAYDITALSQKYHMISRLRRKQRDGTVMKLYRIRDHVNYRSSPHLGSIICIHRMFAAPPHIGHVVDEDACIRTKEITVDDCSRWPLMSPNRLLARVHDSSRSHRNHYLNARNHIYNSVVTYTINTLMDARVKTSTDTSHCQRHAMGTYIETSIDVFTFTTTIDSDAMLYTIVDVIPCNYTYAWCNTYTHAAPPQASSLCEVQPQNNQRKLYRYDHTILCSHVRYIVQMTSHAAVSRCRR